MQEMVQTHCKKVRGGATPISKKGTTREGIYVVRNTPTHEGVSGKTKKGKGLA